MRASARPPLLLLAAAMLAGVAAAARTGSAVQPKLRWGPPTPWGPPAPAPAPEPAPGPPAPEPPAPSPSPSPGGGDHPGGGCTTLRERDDCVAAPDCVWCKNKWSPMPGSDGVCVSEEESKRLPDMSYHCSHKPEALPAAAMPLRWRGALAVAVALLAAALLPAICSAIEAPCSACEAVAPCRRAAHTAERRRAQGELQRRLDAELPRTKLDMRHRLDKDGKRYGKIIEYRLSEMRANDLLDGLCDDMDDFLLMEAPPAAEAGTGEQDAAEGEPTAAGPKAKPFAAPKARRRRGAGAAPELAWVRFRGAGAVDVDPLKRPSKAEQEARGKALKAFCGLLIEEHEDDVVAALTGEAFARRGVAPVLCGEVAGKCSPAAAPPEDGDADGGPDATGGADELPPATAGSQASPDRVPGPESPGQHRPPPATSPPSPARGPSGQRRGGACAAMTGVRPARAFQIVVAATRSWGIGKDGGLPFSLPGDMAYFKALTSRTADGGRRNAVIMGRKTFLSIPPKFRPLPGRLNIVLTSTPPTAGAGGGAAGAPDGGAAAGAPPLVRAALGERDENAGAAPGSPLQAQGGGAAKPAAGSSLPPPSGELLYAPSLEAAMELLEDEERSGTIESVFVIGGGQVYAEAVASERCSAVHLTAVSADPPCDTFFPDITAEGSPWRLWSSARPRHDGGQRYQFLCYTRVPPCCAAAGPAGAGRGAAAPGRVDAVGQPPLLPPGVAGAHDEYQYLGLVRELIEQGFPRGDRTGTGTLSTFGVQHRYDLRRSFPLLTSKRVFWRGVVEELLWFIRGSTNARELSDRGVHIWDGNSSREFLDRQGLGHREEGDLGPVYGFQWRHFGAAYTDMHADYTGQGVDQLAELVQRIRSTPEDRRLILTAWNPAALRDMALPPCHMTAQFYVCDGELSCQLYQRSADVGLGVPFNIASYALLTTMMAQVCGLSPGEFVHTLGDAHVYSNHVEPLRQQLSNAPRHFPRLLVNRAVTAIDGFCPEDFTLLDYNPHKAIKMQMAERAAAAPAPAPGEGRAAAGKMELSAVVELQGRLKDVLRRLAASGGSMEEDGPPALKALLPNAFGGQPGRGLDATAKGAVHSAFRQLALELALEAQAAGAAPLQYVLPGGAQPALARLLDAALLCAEHDVVDASHVVSVLDDVQDVVSSEACLDILTWLEAHTHVLGSARFTSHPPAMQQLTRLCNGILRRLGKHEVQTKARLLLLTASVTPLFDRSGVGVTVRRLGARLQRGRHAARRRSATPHAPAPLVCTAARCVAQGAFAVPDPPQPEEVPEGAVDSAGKPVAVALYQTFWELQGLLQDPLSVLASLDRWATFKRQLGTVLEELARAPATVPAARVAAPATGSGGDAAAAAGGGGAANGGGEAVGATSDAGGGAGTAAYLSSYRLFGLQLTDSSFRRDFLVQVLIALRTLLMPGKVPADSLKPKQRIEALALEKEVYKALEATPPAGAAFARAVRGVLEREATWVAWKKGGRDFVVPGKDFDAPAAAAKKPAPAATNCLDWSKPPVASLADALAKAEAEAAAKAEQKQKDTAEGLALKLEVERSGRQYDNMGEPPERPDVKRRRYLRLLDNGSAITFWAAARVSDRGLAEAPLLDGMRVDQQPQFPTPEAVCAQVLREADPDAGIDREYARVAEDALYRWRLGRVVANLSPETDGLENPERITEAVAKLLPGCVSEALREKLKADAAAAKAEAEAAKAEAGAARAAAEAARAERTAERAAAKAASRGSARAGGGGGGDTPAASDVEDGGGAGGGAGEAVGAALEGEDGGGAGGGAGAAGMEVDAA
ncbi:hypothetical protein HT031_006575 [Scenedesmus sp. PABB004]|nr:hypothetical protein HT031_006575 [Scenedesmus sp. PABB004]